MEYIIIKKLIEKCFDLAGIMIKFMNFKTFIVDVENFKLRESLAKSLSVGHYGNTDQSFLTFNINDRIIWTRAL